MTDTPAPGPVFGPFEQVEPLPGPRPFGGTEIARLRQVRDGQPDTSDLNADTLQVLANFAIVVTAIGDKHTAECLEHARECVRHTAEHARLAAAAPPETVACDLDWPLRQEQVLTWARQARWFITGYYKFRFTFESSGTIAMPDDPVAREFTATATVGGLPEAFYKFQVTGEPTPWSELCYVQSVPDLVLRDADGTELLRIEGEQR